MNIIICLDDDSDYATTNITGKKKPAQGERAESISKEET
jgi:hypothetical protein